MELFFYTEYIHFDCNGEYRGRGHACEAKIQKRIMFEVPRFPKVITVTQTSFEQLTSEKHSCREKSQCVKKSLEILKIFLMTFIFCVGIELNIIQI